MDHNSSDSKNISTFKDLDAVQVLLLCHFWMKKIDINILFLGFKSFNMHTHQLVSFDTHVSLNPLFTHKYLAVVLSVLFSSMLAKDFQDELEDLVSSSMSDQSTPHAGGLIILEKSRPAFESSSSDLRSVFSSEDKEVKEEDAGKLQHETYGRR